MAALAELDAAEGSTVWKMDSTNPEDVKRILVNSDGLDVLASCAVIIQVGSILESTEEEWDFAFDLNAKVMYRLCKAVLPGLLEQYELWLREIQWLSSGSHPNSTAPAKFHLSHYRPQIIGRASARRMLYPSASGNFIASYN